jgi:hypothetical protein
MKLPSPPIGVRIHHKDGTTTGPIDVGYIGIGDDGKHTWVPVERVVMNSTDEVSVEDLPAHTRVAIPIQWGRRG